MRNDHSKGWRSSGPTSGFGGHFSDIQNALGRLGPKPPETMYTRLPHNSKSELLPVLDAYWDLQRQLHVPGAEEVYEEIKKRFPAWEAYLKQQPRP